MRILLSAKLASASVGHVDHALAYAVGLRELGHEVHVVDYAGRGRCVDAAGRQVEFREWRGRQHFEAVMRRYGLWQTSCLVSQHRATHGMTWSDLVRVARQADLLLVRSGKIWNLDELFEAPRCRVFLDGNPGQTQSDFANNEAGREPLERFDHCFTVGLNVGTESCLAPDTGRAWHRLPRPMVMSMWPRCNQRPGRYTTISTWKGRATVKVGGRAGGDKADNWVDYLGLPRRTRGSFEIAMRMGQEHEADKRRFVAHGWRITDPTVLDSFDAYRGYIGVSKAEFSVAHDRYVTLNTGWFSDRSAAYLASGRPVVVQATGFDAALPVGMGLLTFSSPAEAEECIARVEADYLAHCDAARAIASEHLDAAKVLRQLLRRIGH